MSELDKSPVCLKGVGKTRARQLEKLGIHNLRDLIYFFPRAYENRGTVMKLANCDDSAPSSYILTVAGTVKTAKIRKNLSISKFRAFDDTASCEIIFFNSPFIKDIFHIGETFRFYGKASINKSRITLTTPKYEVCSLKKPLADFAPIYPLTEGVSSKLLEKLINDAINCALDEINDPLPEKVRLENELATLKYALKNIHTPDNAKTLESAIKRLAFDEMFYFALGISISSKYKSAIPGFKFDACKLDEFTAQLPFSLTESQKKAINEIYHDTVIKTIKPENGHMARILVGDVGCGKTVCAAAAIYIALNSGFQCALMAPTEILANQHYEDLSELFKKLGYKTALLTGSVTQGKKREIYAATANGEINVIIGTHAILSDKFNFKNLGLVITDEQHRFGVAQRALLNEKNRCAHMLVMSATPIPRTLALALYGDLDVSKITELPKGRQRVDTFVVDESYRARLNDFILKQTTIGGQCYIVCPSIENSEDELENSANSQITANVKEYTENLKQKFKNTKIAAIHGKMKADEKEEIMQSFSSGETKILVCTTVIEVGVNVPNASLMVIENAERYGLSQLHQLRGRVGRGSRKSYCVLVSSNTTEKSRERLNVMKTTYDGFEIANKDLELRGPGDFFASKNNDNLRQSGGFEFKMSKLISDNSFMKKAFSAAKSLCQNDPDFELEENKALQFELNNRITPIPSSIS